MVATKTKALVTVGAALAAFFGIAAVASAHEAPQGGPSDKPDEEDCQTLQSNLTERKAALSELQYQRGLITAAMQDAANAGDEQALADLTSQRVSIDNAIYNANSDIAHIQGQLQECS